MQKTTNPRVRSSSDAEERIACVHDLLCPNDRHTVVSWRSEPFSLGWIVFPVFSERTRGWGPYFITYAGDVFHTGSAHPAEAYVEDVLVMTRATWNPLRYLRYFARRISGGTPTRFP